MLSDFRTCSPREIPDNVFKAIGDDWMLITAGNEESFNTMTASWGSIGILWHLPIAICYIRPQRYTYIFAERSNHYTLSFFTDEHREKLQFCGTKSGREYDKIRETGLTPLITSNGNIAFEEARLILECKKLYSDDIKPEHFIVRDLIPKNYPRKDFHRFYIGEIISVLIRD